MSPLLGSLNLRGIESTSLDENLNVEWRKIGDKAVVLPSRTPRKGSLPESEMHNSFFFGQNAVRCGEADEMSAIAFYAS